jgi:hypothetical protein
MAMELGLARFEEWLVLYKEQDDELGKVARFVFADLENGCWPRRNKVRPRMFYGTDKELEENFTHLRAVHNMSSSSMQTFQRVFEQFRQENNSHEREKLRMRVQDLVHDAMGVKRPDRSVYALPGPERLIRRRLRDMINSCLSGSGVTLSEIASYIASEHLGLPPEEHGRMLTPLVGEEICDAEDWVRSGFVAF